ANAVLVVDSFPHPAGVSGQTDDSGQAYAHLSTTPTGKGTYTVDASVNGIHLAAPFSELFFDPNPATIIKGPPPNGDGQTGQPGDELPTPLTAQVLNVDGQGIPNVQVTWSTNGNGTTAVDANNGTTTSTSDSNGFVRADMTLGAAATIGNGTATATASCTNC